MEPLLYGHNTEERIVAVQHVGDDRMRVFTREKSGVGSRDEAFYPFFFLSDPAFIKGFPQKHWVRELSGNNYFRYLCAFTRWSSLWDAIHHVIEQYNTTMSSNIESYSELPILYFRTDAVGQFLLQTGRTLFKGMTFEDAYRLQLDIETYTKQGFKFSNALRPEDRIIIIALSDNRGWQHVIDGRRLDEKAMLAKLVEIMVEKDPDIIEGHNIFNFDLPYIMKRCELHGIELSIGRDGSTPRSFDARTSFAERPMDYMSYEIAGRHLIDTFLLLQAYDVSKRTLESYSLKYAARHFGFAKQDRIYIKGERISWYWDNEPDLLLRYALEDVEETRQLSDVLLPSSFYLTQIVPFNLGALSKLGSAAKIEALLVREYVRQRHSVPKPQTGSQTTGGYTDVYYTGILGPILHADVESLYPSIMITEQISPATDALSAFPSALKNLTSMRLETKRLMKSANDDTQRSKLDAMQSSYKILINSFYGYLGYNRALFNDYAAADRVTQTGQALLRKLIDAIISYGGKVVEVDTDGIFFVPPPYVESEEHERHFVRQIAGVLPEGINLTIAGRYQKILSYKKKNYALLDYDNKITVKGSSLMSRSLERFGRNFIHQCIDALMNSNIVGLHALYVSLHNDIAEHKLHISDLAKTETLKDSAEVYSTDVQGETRNRSALYEAAIASGIQWKAGDRISYYITGNDSNVKGFENCKLAEEWDPNFPDENIPFYLKRLDELSKKFEAFLSPGDFHSIFSIESLFPFDPTGIQILSTPIEAEKEESGSEPDDVMLNEPKIWLDEG